MTKAKLEVRILDLEKVETIKDLINELLDVIETQNECNDFDTWQANEVAKKRKEYISRFADILTDEK